MNPDELMPYNFRPRRRQIEDLERIVTHGVSVSEHIRRAIDMYLSTPSIQAELSKN